MFIVKLAEGWWTERDFEVVSGVNKLDKNAFVNLLGVAQRLSQGSTSWASEQIGSFNGSQVNVRFMHQSTAEWHVHPETDEMFVVLAGSVTIDTENGSFPLIQNDCFIVKAGTQHRARTDESTTLMTLIRKTA